MNRADVSRRVPVEAGWALWGKHPGTNDDYSVLSCSNGPFSRADFAAIISRFSPGTPSARRQGAGKLPWVTLSWVGADDTLHLGIAVHDVTEHVDGAGRPIAETRYFCVPYVVVADRPISYCGLYEAVQRPGPLPADRGPARLEVPRLDPEEIALIIESYGEPVVAGVAALLLSAPVTITQSEGSELAGRLGFLDAVAALLPYGYRARLTAATWADSGSRHRIRLTFADRPRDGAVAVPWRASPDLPAAPASRDYASQLDWFRRRPARDGRAFDIPEVVTHLARETEPRKFDRPRPAIDSLRAIDLPSAVAAAVRDRNANPAEVRRLFATGRIAELGPGPRREVWLQLLSYGQKEDLPAVSSWWDQVVGDNPYALLDVLVTICRGLLWAPAPAAPLWDYLTLADRQGIGDELLAGLVAAPDDPRDLAGGLADAATLVSQRILGAGRASHPLTVVSLPGNAALAGQTMVRLSAAGADAGPWIDRLTRQAPELMAPFRTVLAPAGGAVTAQAIADLADRGRECVMVLLEAATAGGALSRLLPAVVRWLAANDAIPPAEQRYWGNQLARPTILGGQNRACADLGLLAVGLAPHWLMLAAAQPYWAEYASSFSQEWLILEKIPVSDPGWLTRNLRRYLDQRGWTASAAQVTAVLDLTSRLAAVHARWSIAEIVAFTLAWSPEAKQSPAVQAWLERAAVANPAVFRDGALQSLELLVAGDSPAHIARRCRRAYYDGVPPGTAGRALAASAALAAPAVGQLDSAGEADTLSQVGETLRNYDREARPGLLQRALVPGGMLDPGQVRRKFRSWRDSGPGQQGSAPSSGPGGPETESLSAWAAECLRTARAELDRGRRLPGGQPAAFGAGDSR